MEKDSLRKWLEGTMTEEERKAFEKTEDFKHLEMILKGSQYFKAPDYDVEEELKRINERKEKPAKVVKLNYFQVAIRIAASVLIFFSIWWIFLRGNTTVIETVAGEKSELVLPDSTEVFINAVSSLSYNEKNWKENRNVKLEGEAYFKVAKGKKFDVRTPGGTITVLGTEFNVKQRESFFEVVCFEGLVLVESKGMEVELSPSKMFRVINNQVDQNETISLSSPSWITDESHFQSVPYYEVIRELERQYNVRMKIKNIDVNQLFSGGFTHKNLKSALQSITLPLNINYDLQDDQHVVLTGEMD